MLLNLFVVALMSCCGVMSQYCALFEKEEKGKKLFLRALIPVLVRPRFVIQRSVWATVSQP
jgi:hypothetical protein